jgi:ribosomal protein S18 acetylase RimI-like enzyme
MDATQLAAVDREPAAELWTAAGLTRPWNDPLADFDRAIAGATSTVLGLRDGSELVGTVMVGHDGHRGWVYYLAVADSHQGRGLGSALMAAAEQWLRSRGAVKVQLMVRESNRDVVAFYARLGYQQDEVSVLARWLVR